MAVIKTKICSACEESIDYPWGKMPSSCPACGALYWDKPRDERVLFELQDEFFQERSNRTLGKIYERLFDYSQNMIKSLLRNKHILPEDDLVEKANDIANKIVEKYLKDENFSIKWSFGAMLSKIAKGILFRSRREESHLSLNAHVMDGDQEIEDNLFYKGFDPLIQHEENVEDSFLKNQDSAVGEAYNLIEKIYERISDTEEKEVVPLLYLIALKNRLYSPNHQFLENFFEYSGREVKENIRNTELLLHNYLKEAVRYG